MPENTVPAETAPPITEEEEERKKPKKRPEEEEEETMEIEEHLEKLYKAIGELTDATRKIASAIKASEHTTRGLVEAMKSDIDSLKEEIRKLTVGFDEAAATHKKQDKFPTTGKPETSETAEEVKYPPEGLRERGAQMLEKSREEIVKSVMTPRPSSANTDIMTGGAVADLVRDILQGKMKPGEVASKIKEVLVR